MTFWQQKIVKDNNLLKSCISNFTQIDNLLLRIILAVQRLYYRVFKWANHTDFYYNSTINVEQVNDGSDLLENIPKTVLVTGAAKRLGRAIALDLASHGFAVVVHTHKSMPEAAQTVNEIRQKGGKASLIDYVPLLPIHDKQMVNSLYAF